MFKAVVLLIVMANGVGPVGLLCQALCDPHVAAATGCHHFDSRSTPVVSNSSDCGEVGAAVAILRDDGARRVVDQRADIAALTVEYPITPALVSRSQLRQVMANASPLRHPCSPILRI